MFNIKTWFMSKNTEATAVKQALASYKTTVFPFGIDANWIKNIEQSKTQLSLSLELPFAARQVQGALVEYLSRSLKCTLEVEITTKLPDNPKFKAIQHIVLVASGKGGVGKSTTAINLAYALSAEGAKVGVLDADIYGPSIPNLLGLQGVKPEAQDEKTLLPIEKSGLLAQSIGFLVSPDEATVWRGPMASQALTQLLNETAWGRLDYLIVDMPPGTGDIQLTMSQKVPASGAVIVTTPQDLALADAQKGIAMFNKVNMPILGLIENMSFFVCGHCGTEANIFGKEGGKSLAMRHGVPLLAEIPLNMSVREQGEQGKVSLANAPEIGIKYQEAARHIASALFYQTMATSQVEILMTDD